MKKKEQQKLAQTLEDYIIQSDLMWKLGKPHPFIIGYLQGLIKVTIEKLKS